MEAITREEMLMDGQTLEPITRKEKILAGEDLDPITREEYFLKEYRGGGGDITVESLNVTENGTYTAPTGKAYTPVKVELPLNSKTITENGTYTASDDNLAGYDEVTVAVEGYAKKSIANTPTDIATFNASALPMPSLTVGIEAVQSGTGDPSPTNVRPFSGWSAVNVYDTGKNMLVKPIDIFTVDTTVANCFFIKEGTYVLSYTISESHRVGFRLLDASGNVFTDNAYSPRPNWNYNSSTKAYYAPTDIVSGNQTITFNIVKDCYIRIVSNKASTSFSNAMLELGDTPTTYEAYNGTTTPIQFVVNGETKTIYRGYIEIKNGKVKAVAESAMAEFDGSNDEVWLADNDSTSADGIACFRAYLQNNNIKKPEGTASSRTYIGKMLSTTMPTLKNGYVDQYPMANTVMGITGYSGTSDNYFYIIINKTLSDIQSVAELRAWLAENPTTVLYELDTPIEYDLADVSISTQDGINNIWADSGDVISGEYMEAL